MMGSQRTALIDGGFRARTGELAARAYPQG